MKLSLRPFFTLIFLVYAGFSHAQLSSTGKTFYLSFMEMEARSGNYPDSLLLFITSEVNTTAVIDNPRVAATAYTVTITAGKVNRVSIDPGFYYPKGSELPSTNLETRRSLRVVAKDPINVYCLNFEQNRSDGTFCLPYESIPKAPEFFIASYSPNVRRGSTYMNSEFVVVAMDNNVEVEITPTVRTKGGKTAGTPFTITMPRGMVYQVQSADADGNTTTNISGATNTTGDLTGTRVRVINGCGKINVFSGNKSAFTPWAGACFSAGVDHLYTQVYPTSILGKNYTVMPFKGQSGGYIYRVLASKDTTDVFVNGTKVTAIPLKKGQYYLEYVNSAVARCITTSKPAYCIQFMLNANCGNYGSNNGDPAILIMPDVNQRLLHSVIGTATTVNMNKHFVNILVPKGAKSAVKVNGSLLSSSLFTDISCNNFSYTQVTLANPSTNTIDCDSGFIAVAYGIGQFESYSYCSGALFENLDYDFTMTRPSKCPNVPVKLEAKTTAKNVKNYIWNFGDGFQDTGKVVTHSFKKVGTFYVVLKAVVPAGCGGFDTVVRSQIINIAQGPLYNMPDTLFQCTNSLSMSFTAPVNVKYLYKWQDSSSKNTYTVSSPGKVWLRIKDTSTNCVLFDSTLVQQFNPIKARIAYDTAIKCKPTNFFSLSDSTLYKSDSYKSSKWKLTRPSTKDSFITMPRFRFSFDSIGSYPIMYTVLSQKGCRDTAYGSLLVVTVPTAVFNTKKDAYCQKELATFTDSSFGVGGISTGYWNFGDGSTATGLKVTHTYTVFDTFNVRLITESTHLCRDTVDSMIMVNPLPKMVLTNTINNQCKKANSFSFNDGSTIPLGTISNSWKYMNKTATAIADLSNVKFTDTGNWIVRLTNTSDKGCIDSARTTIYVAPEPVAKINVVDSALCFDVHFYDLDDVSTLSKGTIGSRKWTFSDGTTSNSKIINKKTFSTYGNYNTKLVVTTSTYNCKDSTTHSFVVLAAPLAPFSVNDSTQCLIGNVFNFTPKSTFNVAGVTANYNWTFGDANNSTLATPSHSYASASSFTVKLILRTSQGCADTASRIMLVDPTPVAEFSRNKDSICFGSGTFDFINTTVFPGTYTNKWTLDDGTFATTKDVLAKNFPVARGFDVKLVVTTTPQGCKDSVTHRVAAMPVPKPDFTINNATQCLSGNNFVFTNQTNTNGAVPVSYRWIFTPGSTFTTPTITNQVMPDTGSYSIQLIATSGFGCTDNISKPIYVAETPTISISASDACAGDEIQFNATANINSGSIISYAWTFGDGGTSGNQNPLHAYNNAGTYNANCVATSNKGCTAASGPTSVIAFARPKADFVSEQLMSRGIDTDHKLTFTGSGAIGYLWTFYDGTTDVTGGPVLKTFSDTGRRVAKLWVINSDGCTDSISHYMLLKPELQMWISTSFSPNKDGLNETFGPSTIFGLTKFQMQIFDRWGEKLFESKDARVPWDGRDKKGDEVPEGVYAYSINFRYIDGKIFVYQGTVTLLR